MSQGAQEFIPTRRSSKVELSADLKSAARDANCRVRAMRLLYTVSFRVVDTKGGDYVPPTPLRLSRDITYNDADILAKQAEQSLLYRDMKTDMVQQIMRLLAASRPPKT